MAEQDDKREISGAFWDEHNTSSQTDVRYWLAVERVRRAINLRLTGNADLLFIEQYLRSLESRWPIPRALSIGCGAGELERGVVGLGAVEEMVGIDVSEASLMLAREAAAREGLDGRITYVASDTVSWLRDPAATAGYDLIFFHGSLHHIEDLEGVLEACAVSLSGRGGNLYVDEYIGPSRDEWEEEDLGFAAGMFGGVPHADRRTPRVWPPIAIEDPTEMIRSSEILPVCRQFFEIVDYRPYYGNVLMPLVNAIQSSALEKPPIDGLLSDAVVLEEFLASHDLIEPLYAAFIARPLA